MDTNKTDHIVDILSKDNNRDIALIQRMCEGDMSAFEQVYYRWNKQVYAFMLKTTRSMSDAEDIVQEVFIRLWKMRNNIDPQKSIQSLIFTIARRIAVDLYRQNGKFAETLANESGEESGRSPQEILEEQEMDLLLGIAIENMPEKQRKVFSLYYVQDLSAREIALQLGLSYDNVRKHIYNGKQQLREMVSLMILLFLGQL